ncbi:MAG: hypothetical protein KC592_07005, partial [Nitrospira sp.]|nr:hypothetical protein [Nitrospira sp.]
MTHRSRDARIVIAETDAVKRGKVGSLARRRGFVQTSTTETHMMTDYNRIANQYKKAKEQPWWTRSVLYSMMNL